MDVAFGKRGSEYCDNTIEGIEIGNVSVIRDLGVLIDNKLSFSPHITQLVSTAKQRSFLLFITFKTKDPKALILGYKSYVLPLLNYGSHV